MAGETWTGGGGGGYSLSHMIRRAEVVKESSFTLSTSTDSRTDR